MDVSTNIEIETVKEIICISACEYDLPYAEWMESLQGLLGNEESMGYLSEAALSFIDDISIWARSEEISREILTEAVRRIYEEC